MVRHAAHRGAFTESAVLARQRQFQLARSSPRVIEEHLIKVTEAEEKNAVLIFRLGIKVLLHHRCDARHVCSPLSFLLQFKAPPHNSAARLAMSFPPSAACKFLDLHPVNLRNLHLHLTKNPFASRPPHLRGVTLTCCFYGICLIGFFRRSRRVCGREVVPFWRARKEPKSAQRGLKRVQVWTSAPSGLPPPSKFLAGGRSFSAGLLDF